MGTPGLLARAVHGVLQSAPGTMARAHLVQKTEVFHSSVRSRSGRAPPGSKRPTWWHSRITTGPSGTLGAGARAAIQCEHRPAAEAAGSLSSIGSSTRSPLRRRPDGPDLAGAGSWTIGRETDTMLRTLVLEPTGPPSAFISRIVSVRSTGVKRDERARRWVIRELERLQQRRGERSRPDRGSETPPRRCAASITGVRGPIRRDSTNRPTFLSR